MNEYYTRHPQGPVSDESAKAIEAVARAAQQLLRELESPCIDCEGDEDDFAEYPELVPEECSDSKRPCGHHCNHSWSHDVCCWCNRIWTGEDDGQA